MTDTALQAPPYGVAGALLEALAAQDFVAFGTALSSQAHMQALVPSGVREWDGRAAVCAAFASWFGDLDGFELVDAVVGAVGARLYLRWRLRVRARRYGDGWFVVEQQVYADAEPDGLIASMRLLCSGFCAEPSEA